MFSYYGLSQALFGILGLVLWMYPILIYFDCKKWRRLGVPVYPGLVASSFILLNIAIASNFFSIFGGYFYSRAFMYGYGLNYTPLILLIVYFMMRELRYRPMSKQENPPLPPAPAWSRWLFILIFLIPILLVLLFILVVVTVLRGGSPGFL